jgi:hypothetical protein
MVVQTAVHTVVQTALQLNPLHLHLHLQHQSLLRQLLQLVAQVLLQQ